MTISLFTKQFIREWHRDLRKIPEDIIAYQSVIEEKEKETKEANTKLANVRKDMAPYDAEIAALSAKLTYISNNVRIPELRTEIKENNETVIMLTPLIESLEKQVTSAQNAISTTIQLQEIVAAQKIERTYPGLIKTQRETMVSKNSELAEEEKRQARLERTIRELKSHLKSAKAAEEKYQERIREEEQKLEDLRVKAERLQAMQATGAAQTKQMPQDDNQTGQSSRPGNIQIFIQPAAYPHSVTEAPHLSDRQRNIISLDTQIAENTGSLKVCKSRITNLSEDSSKAQMSLESLQNELASRQQYLLGANDFLKSKATVETSENLSTQLTKQKKDLLKLSGDLRDLQRQSSTHSGTVKSHTTLIKTLENQNKQLIKTAGTHAKNDDVAELEKLRKVQNDLREPHAKIEKGHLETLAGLAREITATKNEISSISNNLESHKKLVLLHQLNETPITLAGNLALRCEKAMEEFVTKHPANQTLPERICLAELERDIQHIKSHLLVEDVRKEGEPDPNEQKIEDGLPNNPDRIRAYEMAGLVISKTKSLQMTEMKSDLVEELLNVIKEFPLDGEENYLLLNRSPISPAELRRQAFVSFDYAVLTLKSEVEAYQKDHKQKPCEKLAAATLELIARIVANKTHVRFKPEYYTRLLNEAKKVLSDSADITKFAELMVHDPIGQTNTTKCIVGGLSLFVGALGTLGGIFLRTAKPAYRGTALITGIPSMIYGGLSLFGGRASGSVVASGDFRDAAEQVPDIYKYPTQKPVINRAALVINTEADTDASPSAPPEETSTPSALRR